MKAYNLALGISMFRAILAVIIGGISVMLLSITAPKLYEMFQIKGWIPGGVPLQVTVTSKWHTTAEEARNGRETYWVAWNGGDITVKGKHRANMFQAQWNTVKIGDTQNIVYIPWSDDTYLKDGVYVSFGNFVFDFVLLTLELFGILFFVRVSKQTFRKWGAKKNT